MPIHNLTHVVSFESEQILGSFMQPFAQGGLPTAWRADDACRSIRCDLLGLHRFRFKRAGEVSV